MDIQEEKLKEILISQREEYQQYLDVLAEKIEPQLKLIIELLKETQDSACSASENGSKKYRRP
ncbi:MAG: hypothetical protein HQ538_05525 [Parcubacteria group bacterium]|nr:hypothetical protein [Parcubacteria group bacterium]